MNPRIALTSAALALGTPASALADSSRPVHRFDLGSGALGLLVEDHSFEQVHVSVTLRIGSSEDPAGLEGLARITAEMLMRGTQRRSRAEIEDSVDTLGSSLEVEAGHTSLTLDGDALTRNLDGFLELLADVLIRPVFPEAELARLKRETLSEIEQLRDNDQALAAHFFRRHLYGDHPYGRPTLGRSASIEAIQLSDVVAFFQRHFVAPNLIIAAAGNITPTDFRAKIATHFGTLPVGSKTTKKLPSTPRPEGRHVTLVDKPERTQTQILLGHDGLAANHPDALALEVVNTAFGGTFTARLMQEIRVRHGWSYGAYSRLASNRDAGSYYMWIYPATEDAIAATRRTIELYEALRGEGLSAQELEFSKRYLTNAFAFATETPSRLAEELVRMEILELPADHLSTYIERVKAVDMQTVKRVIGEHLHPDRLVITILCTADELAETVAKLPGLSAPPQRVAHDAP